ncbi:RDD family protein [Bradyrhizobium prioriisuperbiae]|uniref:RDD family protein n=1 Tax=Bradyrhizobium prioriisuperbiae TaxID=2854389 RepID=UPI0028EEB169|nr:RDD family protein [Bradyrhizobium prioritasuperba]
MSDSSRGNGYQTGTTWRSGGGFDAQPHAYDPATQPELFRGVLIRRVVAFIIDLIVLSIPILLSIIFIAIFGVLTLSLGWMLFGLVTPFSVIWALIYYGMTLGGPHSATVGMRLMDLQLRTWYGAPGYFVLGAVHPVLFWVSISVLSPLVVLVGLLNGRKRLLHDIVLGTVIINSSARVAAFQPARTV